ncbi:MAG: hypothetical protein HQK64_05190 [Desulfamplus sp.]|nr:hypothetical protein [Desulfamplus sp.]MBF0209565.1 hypothetical protein [Desulfamplus sp.]MBF0241859.1 hypothetical protein [Desulfamplus sp.]MBF0388766.1 hypothetical protein [Desulfamplus sp.]
MSDSIIIFIVGITGVFVGMGFLWLFITLTSIITDKIDKNINKEEAK